MLIRHKYNQSKDKDSIKIKLELRSLLAAPLDKSQLLD